MSAFDTERAAQAMFPDHVSASRSTPPPDQTVQPEKSMAERMFGQPQARVARHEDFNAGRPISELDDVEQGRRLFGGTDPILSHADAVQVLINAGLEDHLHDPQTAGEIAADYAAIFAQHELSATDSKVVAEIGAQALRNPPTPELVTSWTEQALQTLKTDYGVAGAGQALEDARRYIASVPDAADMLDAFGLGSHPKIVALAAARGRLLRLSGRLP